MEGEDIAMGTWDLGDAFLHAPALLKPTAGGEGEEEMLVQHHEIPLLSVQGSDPALRPGTVVGSLVVSFARRR